MFLLFLSSSLLGLAQTDEPPVEVVVTARRSCSVVLRGRTLSHAELDRYAAEWARGREVRVTVPRATDYRCLAKIMFRLSDRGVTRATFVDADAP